MEDKKEEEKNQEISSDDAAKCQKERDEYLEGWKRAKADLINYKKDEIKRFETVMKMANESLIKELIGVLDSFDLALNNLEKEGKAEKGVYLIRTQLEDVLKKSGLEKMVVSVGEIFNPAFCEVIAAVESDKPSGTIIEEIEKGYSLNGKIIRPARVKVAK
ncbi:MAG: nucleotide exchange factor GrpE [Patescibacteria group bacterium]